MFVPFVTTGLEHIRFRQGLRFPLRLQMKQEKRKFNVVAIELCRLAVERDWPQTVTVAARPSAVDPRTHHDNVVCTGALLFSGTI